MLLTFNHLYFRRDADGLLPSATRQFRPLYDIPFMFEAREYLRKRLIGKVVTVTVDYIGSIFCITKFLFLLNCQNVFSFDK